MPAQPKSRTRAPVRVGERPSKRPFVLARPKKSKKEKDPAGNYGATPFDILSSDTRPLSQHGFS
jgi:hypothetical protein